MPEIPRYKQQVSIPGTSGGVQVNPEAVGAPYAAETKMGQSIADIGEKGLYLTTRYEHKEEMARQGVEAAKLENSLRNDLDKIAESYKGRTDYDNFEKDGETALTGIKDRYDKEIKDQAVKNAFEKAFQQQSFVVQKFIRDAKANAITLAGQNEWQIMQDNAIRDWVNAGSDEERNLIAAQTEAKGRALAERNVLRPEKVTDDMRTFNAKAQEAYVRRIWSNDPERALNELDNPARLTGIDPLRRAELRDHAVVKINQEGTRLEKLTKRIQVENQEKAIDMLAAGSLDLDKLNQFRARDPETGRPGLSDQFYVTWRDKLMSGKDTMTDPGTFNNLYVKRNLTKADIDAASDRLSPSDQRTLLGVVRHQADQIEQEARYYRRQEENDARREERAKETQAKNDEQAIRSRAFNDGRDFLKKKFNEDGIKADDGIGILKAYDAMIRDRSVKPEELVDKATKMYEQYQSTHGILNRIGNWFSGTPQPDQQVAPPANRGSIKEVPKPWEHGTVQTVIPAPTQPAAAQRPSLDTIFGAKK